MDLFFPKAPNNKQTAMLVADIFTNCTHVVITSSKQPPDVSAGIMEAINNTGGKAKPRYIQIAREPWYPTLLRGGSNTKGSGA
eukprot:16427816-Heterocapsa_arctica.AAC.1